MFLFFPLLSHLLKVISKAACLTCRAAAKNVSSSHVVDWPAEDERLSAMNQSRSPLFLWQTCRSAADARLSHVQVLSSLPPGWFLWQHCKIKVSFSAPSSADSFFIVWLSIMQGFIWCIKEKSGFFFSPHVPKSSFCWYRGCEQQARISL